MALRGTGGKHRRRLLPVRPRPRARLMRSQRRVAVEMEAFEDAAALRDRIRGIEKAPVDATRAAVRGDRADGERDGA